MRPYSALLLLAALAIPASLALPSARMAAGESCAMSCDHGAGVACCCVSGGGSAFRRCPTPGDWFLHSSASRAVAPAAPGLPVAPALSGFLALMTADVLLRVFSERPDPVPRLLS